MLSEQEEKEADEESEEVKPVITLLCGGLPFEVTSEDIRAMFACHGTVLKANVS